MLLMQWHEHWNNKNKSHVGGHLMLRNFLRTCCRSSCTLRWDVLGFGDNLESCWSPSSLNSPIQLRCSTLWQKRQLNFIRRWTVSQTLNRSHPRLTNSGFSAYMLREQRVTESQQTSSFLLKDSTWLFSSQMMSGVFPTSSMTLRSKWFSLRTDTGHHSSHLDTSILKKKSPLQDALTWIPCCSALLASPRLHMDQHKFVEFKTLNTFIAVCRLHDS